MSQLSANARGPREMADLPLFSQLGQNQHRPGGKYGQHVHFWMFQLEGRGVIPTELTFFLFSATIRKKRLEIILEVHPYTKIIVTILSRTK